MMQLIEVDRIDPHQGADVLQAGLIPGDVELAHGQRLSIDRRIAEGIIEARVTAVVGEEHPIEGRVMGHENRTLLFATAVGGDEVDDLGNPGLHREAFGLQTDRVELVDPHSCIFVAREKGLELDVEVLKGLVGALETPHMGHAQRQEVVDSGDGAGRFEVHAEVIHGPRVPALRPKVEDCCRVVPSSAPPVRSRRHPGRWALLSSLALIFGCPQWNETVIIAREASRDAGGPARPPVELDAAIMGDASQTDTLANLGDLRISAVSPPPPSVVPGSRILLEVEVAAGPEAATPNTQIQLRLLPESLGAPRALTTIDVPAMAAADRIQLAVSALVPPDTPGQRYCLEAEIDPGKQVKEHDESNNQFKGGCLWISALQIAESELDFGTVGLGCSATATITIHNWAGRPTQILSADVQGTSRPFSQGPETLLAPYFVEAGGQQKVSIIYEPQRVGLDRRTYTIEHSAALGQLSVPLVGAAMQAPVRIENHLSWSQPRIDLLIVVDNSSTMQQEQSQITQASSALLNLLYESQVDYHLGVTTTDTSIEETRGRLRGGTMTPQTPRLGHELAQALNVGTTGSEVERGLLAAQIALRAQTNPGFRRPEAGLMIMFISDEDDDSPSQPYLRQYLDSVGRRGGLGLRIASVVSSPEPTQQCPSGVAPGLRYRDLAEATDGPQMNLCTFTWASDLSGLLSDTLGRQTAFELQASPLPQTLEVFVNGVLQAATDAQGAVWRLQGNTVHFESAHAPSPGARLRFSYRTEC